MLVSDARYAYTDAALIARCLEVYPSLERHACRNGSGPTFAAVMERTSTPHLLEHLVIDAQTRMARDAQRVFTGTTQWEDALRAVVAVSFEDDLSALRAFGQQLAFLNGMLVSCRG